MPDAWPVFFHKRRLWPVQKLAIPHILRGASIFISSPTASGKTESAAAPLYQRHVSFKRRKLGVVYVAPTKALVNDIYYRLSDYLGGGDSPSGLFRYTGDHHDLSSPEDAFLIVATPEALDSLQLTKPRVLDSVRAVVVDEVHLLHGSPRGQQLRSVISRIRGNLLPAKNPKDIFQVVGMSATMDDIEDVIQLWAGSEARHVAAPGIREVDLGLVSIVPGLQREAITANGKTIRDCVERLGVNKILIFGNTRNEAHAVAISLKETLANERWPVYLHMGILSGPERDRIEEGMKRGECGICVATSALEVGIDIGDIEAVMLLSPPPSVGAYLQRIGRGNRRSGVCRVIGFYRSESEKMLYEAMDALGREGRLDETHEYERPSVVFQQVLSLCWAMMRKDRAARRQDLRRQILVGTVDEVVDDMVRMGHLRSVGEGLIPSDQLIEEGDRRYIHTVIAGAAGQPVVNPTTGETVATMDRGLIDGDYFLDGHIRSISSTDESALYLGSTSRRGARKIGKIPSWGRGWRSCSRTVAWELARRLGYRPEEWFWEGEGLVCWGGHRYARLLSLFCEIRGFGDGLGSNEFSVTGFQRRALVNPAEIAELASEQDILQRIETKKLEKFRDSSRYYRYLSNEMKAVEARRAVPLRGFLAWLKECRLRDAKE